MSRMVSGRTRTVRSRPLPSTEALLMLAVVLWALSFSTIKYAVTHGFTPLAFTGPRFALAAIAMAGVAVVREGPFQIARHDAERIAMVAFAGVFLNQIAFVFALDTGHASTVALVFGSSPIFVVLLAHTFGVERVTRSVLIAVALSALGVGLLFAGPSRAATVDGRAIGLGLVTAITWAVYSVGAAPLLNRYSPLHLNAVVSLVGCVPLLAISLPAVAAQNWNEVSAGAWGAFLFGAIGAYALTNTIWFAAVGKVGASRAALFANLEPFIGAVAAVIVLGESLSPVQVAGGAAVAGGVAIARVTSQTTVVSVHSRASKDACDR